MAERSIFRQAALDRLASPEQLDRLMVVTQLRGWIALAGVWFALFVAIAWSIFGSIPTTVGGAGIIMSSAGLREVEVLGSGAVESLAVAEGQLIEEGDLIARIGQPQIRQEVAQARERIRLLESERTTRLSFATSNSRIESETLDQEWTGTERQISVLDDRIGWLEGRVEAETEARGLGLITEEVVRNTIAQLEAARGERQALGIALQNVGLRRLLLENRAVETAEQMDERIREAERVLEQLELQLEQTSIVTSPYRGYVREVRTDVGQLATAGQSIISVEMVGSPLHAVVFVPREGKRIQAGMEAQISPETVRREEYGFMVGEVTAVSAQPVTPQGMRRVLHNDVMVQQLSAQGAPFMVTITLTRDENTLSGFAWSSSEGPPVTVESGTTAMAQMVVRRQRPISLVLPAIRRFLGLAA